MKKHTKSKANTRIAPNLLLMLVIAFAAIAVVAYQVFSPNLQTTQAAATQPVSYSEDPIDLSDTDNTINNFLKNEWNTGHKRIMASGGWWNTIAQANEDQLWTVVRNPRIIAPDTVAQMGTPISQEFTCLMPGRAGMGTSPTNFIFHDQLLAFDGDSPLQLRSQESGNKNGNTLGTFVTMTKTAPTNRTNGTTSELRIVCNADRIGKSERLRVNFDTTLWWGNRPAGVKVGKNANHLSLADLGTGPLDPNWDLVDVHAWYTTTGYRYGAVANIPQIYNRRLSGIVDVYGYSPNSETYHHGLKIEVDGNDYWVANDQYLLPISGGVTLGGDVKGKRYVDFKLDTTKYSDGVHILSHHYHSKDPKNPDHQLAGELKWPICIDNNNTGLCDNLPQ